MHWCLASVMQVQGVGDIKAVITRQVEPTPAVAFTDFRHPGRNERCGKYADANALYRFVLKLALYIDVGKHGGPRVKVAINPELDFRTLRELSDCQQIECLVEV